ncbi:MAG: CvpA family protein [Pirellulales bacterium]|nr:CvpA family protein [Pirellulales bacterium]
MQTYDILMLLVLLAATLFGFWKGMAWQVASLASLVLSYFAALRFADQLAPMISNHAPWNKFVAMLAIYIATSFVIWTLFRLVSGIIDKVKMESFDHQMGGLIGFAKGVLLCIAVTFFAVTILPQSQKDMIIASQAGQYIVRLLDKTDTIVPPEIHEVIHPYVLRIEQRLDPNYQPRSNQDFQTQWPSELVPSWPTEAGQPSEQPSVYQPQPPSTWPPSEPAEPPPSWPSQPHTADRVRGAPL